MNSNELIKRQDTPRKRIMALAKQYTKERAGIAASDKDITYREITEALFVYLKDMEDIVSVQQQAISKLIKELKEEQKKVEDLKIRLSNKT